MATGLAGDFLTSAYTLSTIERYQALSYEDRLSPPSKILERQLSRGGEAPS